MTPPKPPTDDERVSDARRDRVVFGLLVLGIAALYLPSLGVPFEYDDKVELLQNRVLRSPGDLGEMWAYNPFRVLLLYTFAWDLWAWGIGNVWAWRLENVLIHVVNTGLLLGVVRALQPRLRPDWTGARAALLVYGTAVVFALHPLAIESVTYVSGRSSSLATLFVLAATRLWLAYVDRVEADPAAAGWLAARLRRLNVSLGVLLGAALVAGGPAAWLVAHERITTGRGLAIGIGGTALLLTLLAAIGADRWRALAPPEASEETRATGRAAGNRLVLAFIAFVAGALTKEIAAMLPVILFVIEWIAIRRGDLAAARQALRGRLFPFVAVPAFLVALRVVAYGYVASPTFIRPWTDNLLTQAEVVVQYLRLWVVPFPQSIYHAWPVVPAPGTLGSWLCLLGLLTLLGAALRGRRSHPALSLGLIVAAVTLAPTSSIFALKETMVEHRTYLPSIGFALASAAVFAGPVWDLAVRVGRSRPVIHATLPLALWCAGLAVEHVSYHQLWKSEEVLWRSALAVNPEAADAWRYLGDLYAGQSRWNDAQEALESGLRYAPDDPELMNKLGRVHGVTRRLDDAAAWFEKAVAADGCHTPALNNLARVHAMRGDLPGAVDLYLGSIECEPEENYVAHRSLGDIYYSELHDKEKAGHHYTRALEALDPASPEAPLLKARLLELTW